MWVLYWCLLLLVLHSCEVRGVIWCKPKGQQDQVTPREIRVQDSVLYHGRGRPASQEARLFKRQSPSNTTNIGFTAALTGDNHPHGLVHWTGYPSEVLFVLTRSVVTGLSRQSWLWRSTDYGHTFQNDTVMWHNNTVINWYYISPLSEYLIFADITNSMLWVTRDEGVTYTGHSLPFPPNRITFQSRRAPGSNSTMLAQYVLGYDSTRNQLWVSTDLGTNWQKLGENITRYSWRVLSSAVENNTTVYYEQTMNATHSQLWTSTFPYTARRIFGGLSPFLTDTFVLSNEYMFVQMSNSSSATQYSSPLWVSRNRQPFRQARFPLRSQERHYAVVDTSEGQVFMGVYHDINSTNLYLSEAEGVEYTLSLTSMISPPETDWIQGYPEFDLHVVEGLVGTFVANRRDPSGRFGSSVISYDKGGNWAQLRPPTLDRNGNFIDCQQPNCSLHLHIRATRDTGFQSILTQDSAIGLIMAAGNLGSSLVNVNSQLRQYFSRDGGFTWFEVDTGFKQYQFAAQGAIVASVSVFSGPTSSAKWSCDEGATWDSVSFSDGGSGVTVIGMLTEPGERALHVSIFGIKFPFVEWLVIDLDFTQVLPNQCAPQDFFTWVPTDDRPGSRCLLGESITYERRRSDVCCYVHPGYNRLVSRTTCTCAQEDFECDFGFERIFLNSPCTPMPDFLWPPPQPSDCHEGDNYTISSGYRRVAGDKCIAGQELSYFPITLHCIVGAPKIISLQSNSVTIIPETSVTFNIVQIQGGKVGTLYRWDYNDSTNATTVIGYEQAQERVHTFLLPGVYNVSVLASNEQGSSFFSLSVSVIDPISSVHIQPPSQLTPRKEVPVDTQLVFGSTIGTSYNTSATGPVQYAWAVEDAPIGATPIITHTFHSPGAVSVTLSVLNAGSHVAVSSLAVIVLDRLTGVELRIPRDLVAGTEVTLISSHTTRYSSTSTGLITYHWDFGDGVTNTTTQPSFTHTFLAPGNYTIGLSVNNNFFTSRVINVVVVLDKVLGVEIVPPMHIIQGEVPTNVPLVFAAQVLTQYHTSITGSLRYSWDFGDGSSAAPSTSATTVSHTYSIGGSFTVNCTVQGPMVTKLGQFSFVVFEASDSGSVEITSSDLIDGSFVLTGQDLSWRVESTGDTGSIIPPNTRYNWLVHSLSSSAPTPEPSCHNFTGDSSQPEYNLTLTCWGQYQITVRGNYSTDTFVSQLRITAEAAITSLSLAGVPPVLRAGGVTYLTLASKSHGAAYQGPITLRIMDANSSDLVSPFVDLETAGSNSLLVQLSRDEATTPEKNLTITASNDVSNLNRPASVILAVHGEYEELRVLFLTSQLPRNYKSSSFMDGLKNALIFEVRSRYLANFYNSLVEIEGSGIKLQNSSNVSIASPRVVARSEPLEVLYLDLNILPQSLQQKDIQAIGNVSRNIRADFAKGVLTVTVQGVTIEVRSVEARNSGPQVIVMPTTIVEPASTRLYVALGAGLGAGLILILAIAVLLGVVLYIYRRNYKRLNVRYARLRQTPVRFTFTQGGEMVEDEDYEEPSSDEEEEVQVDNHSAGVKLGSL